MSEYRPEIERLAQRWSKSRETPDPPRSTMDIIEYGLGKQRRAEVYVNHLLCYLLDPENPHGMGADLLDAMLRELPDELEFVEDTYDRSAVRVDEQVGVRHEDEGWQKYPTSLSTSLANGSS